MDLKFVCVIFVAIAIASIEAASTLDVTADTTATQYLRSKRQFGFGYPGGFGGGNSYASSISSANSFGGGFGGLGGGSSFSSASAGAGAGGYGLGKK